LSKKKKEKEKEKEKKGVDFFFKSFEQKENNT
jgi:hypothetical protein